MPATVHCIEPDRRPATLSLPVEEGDVFQLCLLEPDEVAARDTLRATALRRQDEALPAGAELLLEGLIARAAAGGALVIRVLAVSARRPVESLRGESRSRLAQGSELRGSARCELSLDGAQRVAFHLGVTAQAEGGAGVAVSGSGTRGSQALGNTRGALWLLPTALVLLTDLDDQVVGNARAVGRKLGLSPRMAGILVAASFVAFAYLTLWYQKANAVDAATLQATQATDGRDAAEGAAAAALAGEQSCLAERASLVMKLGEADAARGLAAEAALALTGARATALAMGGRRYGADEVLAYDALLVPSVKEAAVAQMRVVGEAPKEAPACLSQVPLLGSDLPRYALLWHPDPALSCPAGYLAVRGGTTLAGRWGLSPRVAKRYLETATPTAGGADPRLEDRAAARAFLAALRDTQTALLTHRSGARAPVPPSQAQLWSLALFAAIDALPSPADGVLDADIPTCVGELLDQLAARDDAPAPGEPVLPDLAAVALGETKRDLVPSPTCPWPEGALQQGATSALSAVSRLALADAAPVGN